jgi:hypothetical protein
VFLRESDFAATPPPADSRLVFDPIAVTPFRRGSAVADQEINLEEKFPDLQPIRSAPSLFTINGCGLMLYGSRDYDADTETYVKTQCLTFIFVPLMGVRAYRVANAEQGWYFIGREPLSAFARIWNVFLVAGVMAAIGIGSWVARTSSPEYVARKDLEQAQELASAGQWRDAAARYVKVVQSGTSSAAVARARIDRLFADLAETATADDGLALITLGDQLRHQAIHVADLELIALKLASRHAAASPRKSFEILQVVDRLPIVPEEKTAEYTKRRLQVRETVLVALVAAEKDAVDAAAELAVIRESQGKLDECKKLLEPRLARLGDTEGARILGQIYARGGDIEKAHRLLVPYCKNKLNALHEAERAYDATYNAFVQRLRQEPVPTDLQNRVNAANPDQRKIIWQQDLMDRVKKDVGIADARRALQKAARVVPVALDLGIVLLQRSRTLKDPADRQRELKQAEETFLAIRGMAGQTEEYQMFLGQVYYWMGKQKEGRKLFDEFLAKRKRDYRGLMLLANTLRSLGATTDARRLSEEAYKSASKDEDRHPAASLRALLSEDTDDKVVWLRRANPNSLDVQADLNSALGHQAERDGRDAEAAGFFRKAIAIYDKMPVTSSSLNNGGLVWLSLYRVTGDKAAFDKGIQQIEKAVALAPSDSVLMFNTAYLLHEAAAADLIGKAINITALQLSASLDLLRYLYRNDKERNVWIQRVRKHAGIKRSDEYFEKAMLLAPQNAGSYFQVAATRVFLRDAEGLKALFERLRTANVDTADLEKNTLDYIRGKDLDKTRRQKQADVARLRKAIATLQGRKDATFAVACCRLSSDLIALGTIDERVDVDEIVRLAEDAHEAAPSSGTLHSLINALAYRAVGALAAKSPPDADKVKKSRRTMSALYLLAALARHDESAQARLQKDADVTRIVSLEKESGRAFPGERSAVEWALLSRIDPAEAKQVAAAVQKDAISEVTMQAMDLILRTNPTRAMDAYWKLEMQGRQDEAAKVVERLRKQGIELPLPKP